MPRIDTNVIIRYLTGEPTNQAERVRGLFERMAGGELSITVDEITVAESVWTLSSFYHLSRTEIASLLLGVLAQEGMHSLEMPVIRAALALYREKGIGFADALLCARMLDGGDREIYSFDRHFDRVEGVIRREPD